VELRIGQGFDVHPFSSSPGRRLVLGGVEVDGRGLDGHSDADVVCHAVIDALLGAAGLGDIGGMFPDADPAWLDADSLQLLAVAVQRVAAHWKPVNVDCTLLAEVPRIAPHREEMQAALSRVVAAPVSVKAKRAEGLGALGRREGIACFAVALLERH